MEAIAIFLLVGVVGVMTYMVKNFKTISKDEMNDILHKKNRGILR